jgi:hypothetical protein
MLVMGLVLVVTILYLPQGLIEPRKGPVAQLRGSREPA